MKPDNTVDLSDVNKTKKQFKLPAFKNPLKKQKGPVRDQEGKFASGSGGLFSKKKFNLKRTLPVVLIVAVVGGFFVFQSFATTKRPNLQYSVFTCSEVSTRERNPDYTCYDYSAEAGVYRAYKAALGRYPSSGDYQSWVQPMVGGDAASASIPGRLMYKDAVKRMLATPEAKRGNGAMANNANDGQVVVNVFRNSLAQTATNQDIFYWVKQKADKKWSLEEMVIQIITSKNARDKQRPSFLSAKQNNQIPRIRITDYAARRETNRRNLANQTNSNNKRTLEEVKKRNADNRARLAASQAIASQPGSQISKGEYESIQKNNADVIKARASGFKGSEYMGRVNARLKQITELNEVTKQVKSQSPDIVKDDKMQREYNFAAYVKDQMNREIEHANWLYGETMKAFNSAKKKHDDHQAWLRAKADCEAKGGTFNNWRCTIPQPATPGGGGVGSGDSDSGGTGSGSTGTGTGTGTGSGGTGSTVRKSCPNSNYTLVGDWCYSRVDRKAKSRQGTDRYCPAGYKEYLTALFSTKPCARAVRATVTGTGGRY